MSRDTSGKTANDAWIGLLRQIYECGIESKPRGLLIKEVLCNTTKVDMRWPIVTVKARKLGFKFLAAEAWWILSGRNDVASIKPYSQHIASFSNDGYHFDGAYGPRIVDQIRYVVDTLERDPDSRQAVIEIWRPNPRDSKDVPCTLTLQFLIREGKFSCIDTMRSSDAWLGWPYDTFNFTMLSTYILLLLRERDAKFHKIELGSLWLTAGSSHLYVNPKEDGATNIPYTLEDVREVLTENACQLGRTNPDDWAKRYRQLSVGQFSYPLQLLEHLALCKEKVGTLEFMKEFQQ